jgi:hypothetical protein
VDVSVDNAILDDVLAPTMGTFALSISILPTGKAEEPIYTVFLQIFYLVNGKIGVLSYQFY